MDDPRELDVNWRACLVALVVLTGLVLVAYQLMPGLLATGVVDVTIRPG